MADVVETARKLDDLKDWDTFWHDQNKVRRKEYLADRRRLKPGDLVKIARRRESMSTTIVAVKGDTIFARLESKPFPDDDGMIPDNTDLTRGELLQFERRHVADMDPDAERQKREVFEQENFPNLMRRRADTCQRNIELYLQQENRELLVAPLIALDWPEGPLRYRIGKCFDVEGILMVGDIVRRTEAEFLDMPGFGAACLAVVKAALAKYPSLHLGMKLDTATSS